ncbi:murein biosynthesis integral membrane protein MurJ [Pareuzebyella sediminis]|uniref:murein biosynthesis integral membrane protein MurJ n=1 Tax=Pareuzebyella sediminis TaxID=2607998 RepID=UPI0011EBCB79|nr:lipid II flippase MurJ [Pareuzebyella sediminis]
MKFKPNIRSFLKKTITNPLLINMATVISITYAIKVIGFFKESYIAYEYGLSAMIDTYLLAMIIPSLIQAVFLSSFSNVFVPNYVIALKQNKDIADFQASSFLLTIAISFLLVLIVYFFFEPFVEVFFPGHEPSYYEMISRQFYLLVLCIPFWGVSSLLTGMLNIENEYRFSSLTPIFIPIVTIIAIYFFQEQLKESVLAASTLVGSILGFLYVLIVNKGKGLLRIGKPDLKDLNFIAMLKQVPYKMSSSLFTNLIPSVDKFFAAKLVVGSVAAISFGQKIPAFVLGFSITGLGTVLLPYFSKLANENPKKAFKELFKILKILFLGSLLIIVALIYFSQEIVELLFQRNEFDNEDTEVVSRIQQILLLYVPFYLCGNVLVKFLTSFNKNKFMAKMSFMNFVVNIFLDYILFKNFGVYGIVMATSIIYSINPIIYYMYAKSLSKKLFS